MMPGHGGYYQQSPHAPLHPQQYHPQQPQPHSLSHPPPPAAALPHHPHPLSHHPQHPGAAMQTPQRPPPSSRQAGPTPGGGHYMQMGTPSNPGPSSAKRARTASSANAAPASGPPNAIIGAQDAPEDEEDTSRGDLFDHIPARDISTHRYKQHHEWFEEVFTSPYGSSDIKPGSIGLEQLGDWVKPLIDGLIDKEGNPTPGKSYNEALRQIGERARAETAKIQSQIEEMDREHRRHLDEFRAGRLLLDADRELRETMIKEDLAPLGLTLPDADYESFRNPRSAAEIIADIESRFNIKLIEVLERDGAHCWNIQPEVIAYEEAQAREAAAAAAAAKAAAAKAAQEAKAQAAQAAAVAATPASNTPGGGDGGAGTGTGSHESANKDQDSAMAGVVATERSSSVHPPPDATAATIATTAVTTAPSAAPTTTTTAADHDTVMSDAEPLQTTSAPTTTAATVPTTAAASLPPPAVVAPPITAAGSTGTPASSGLSPFGIPSPSTAAGFTPGPQSGAGTPSLPTSLPPLGDPTKPQTPSALATAAVATPGSKAGEPPTVPGEDEVPDGFTGGDDELDLDFGGGGAAEALDLLGADSSFADDFE
ncbi:hypothetical protein TWF696_004192 [Orbilia brochopaga]|uniref:SWI/SNF and RSC complexes subunit Ssr4 C-terminal domain-containing protein n=1 Tax=Orbilia brochopaga TaxID=3140254 RepID=A0AAV9V807_9PEZI